MTAPGTGLTVRAPRAGRTARRLPVAALAAVGVTAALVTGCGSSVAHLGNICADVTTGTGQLDPYVPADPVTAVTFALGRFTLVERAVSTARGSGLPAADAAVLRRDWLDPAVTSLATWTSRLEALRLAADAHDTASVAATLPAALAVGTEGVDTAALSRLGLIDCARAFTAPTA